MTIKKNIKTKSEQIRSVLVSKENDRFWQPKTLDDLIKEQGVKPVKDQEDFQKRFIGGFEDWNDIDEFLKEVRG